MINRVDCDAFQRHRQRRFQWQHFRKRRHVRVVVRAGVAILGGHARVTALDIINQYIEVCPLVAQFSNAFTLAFGGE